MDVIGMATSAAAIQAGLTEIYSPKPASLPASNLPKNPTGRSKASRIVEFWEDAEAVVGEDLGQLKNSIRFLQEKYGLEAIYRIPDYYPAGKFIIDVKYYDTILSLNSQMRDFLLIAETEGIPLWLYVKENTHISGPLIDAVENTGGGIVRYFP